MIDTNPNSQPSAPAPTPAPTTTPAPSGDAGQGQPPVTIPGTIRTDQLPAGTSQEGFRIADILGEDGSFSEGWTAKFEEADSLGKYKNLNELVKGFVNANKLIGKKSEGVSKPGDGASEEEIKAWRAHLGVPDSPDGYSIPDEYKDDYDEASFKEFAEFAHKHNIPAETAQELLKYQDALYRKNNEEFGRRLEAASKEAEKYFKQEWGPQYERNAIILKQSLVNAGVNIDDPALSMALNNTYILEALYEKAAKYQEGAMPTPAIMGGNTATIKQQMLDMVTEYGDTSHMPKDVRERYYALARNHIEW